MATMISSDHHLIYDTFSCHVLNCGTLAHTMILRYDIFRLINESMIAEGVHSKADRVIQSIWSRYGKVLLFVLRLCCNHFIEAEIYFTVSSVAELQLAQLRPFLSSIIGVVSEISLNSGPNNWFLFQETKAVNIGTKPSKSVLPLIAANSMERSVDTTHMHNWARPFVIPGIRHQHSASRHRYQVC